MQPKIQNIKSQIFDKHYKTIHRSDEMLFEEVPPTADKERRMPLLPPPPASKSTRIQTQLRSTAAQNLQATLRRNTE